MKKKEFIKSCGALCVSCLAIATSLLFLDNNPASAAVSKNEGLEVSCASVRIVEYQGSETIIDGMRFHVTLTANEYAKLDADDKVGVLLFPDACIPEEEELTVDTQVAGKTLVNLEIYNEDVNEFYFDEDRGLYEAYCYLNEFPALDEAYRLDIAARAYTIFDGEDASYSNKLVRSFESVAHAAINDRSNENVDDYVYQLDDGSWSPYTQTQIGVLENFLTDYCVTFTDGDDVEEKAVTYGDKVVFPETTGSDFLGWTDDMESGKYYQSAPVKADLALEAVRYNSDWLTFGSDESLFAASKAGNGSSFTFSIEDGALKATSAGSWHWCAIDLGAGFDITKYGAINVTLKCSETVYMRMVPNKDGGNVDAYYAAGSTTATTYTTINLIDVLTTSGTATTVRYLLLQTGGANSVYVDKIEALTFEEIEAARLALYQFNSADSLSLVSKAGNSSSFTFSIENGALKATSTSGWHFFAIDLGAGFDITKYGAINVTLKCSEKVYFRIGPYKDGSNVDTYYAAGSVTATTYTTINLLDLITMGTASNVRYLLLQTGGANSVYVDKVEALDKAAVEAAKWATYQFNSEDSLSLASKAGNGSSFTFSIEDGALKATSAGSWHWCAIDLGASFDITKYGAINVTLKCSEKVYMRMVPNKDGGNVDTYYAAGSTTATTYTTINLIDVLTTSGTASTVRYLLLQTGGANSVYIDKIEVVLK